MANSHDSLRAQLLATEHWSLLASRSTTQSEVLTRVSMFLTLTSAGLVSLALVGQATKFSELFGVFAIAVLALVCLVGLLTEVRVFNVGFEDLMYVLAMNRLRAAYVELDPGVLPYLLASTFDDEAGSVNTYYFLKPRSSFGQIAGSSMVFISAVNSGLLGLLGAAIVLSAGGTMAVAITVGVVAGVLHLLITIMVNARGYRALWSYYRPLNPTAPN